MHSAQWNASIGMSQSSVISAHREEMCLTDVSHSYSHDTSDSVILLMSKGRGWRVVPSAYTGPYTDKAAIIAVGHYKCNNRVF